MEETETFKKQKWDGDPIPGIPKDVALLCLSRLSQRTKAVCRCVSKPFRETLSDEELLKRVCEEQGIPSKQRLVFMCLGKKRESSLTYQDAEMDEGDEENEVYDDCDEEGYRGIKYTGLIWLMLDAYTGEWYVLFELAELGWDLQCRSIRLVAGHHPGQVLIHGLITNLDPSNEFVWKQQSQIWSLDLFSMKIFPCVKSRVYRTGFAWANINDHVIVAAGRPYPDRGDYMALFDVRTYYGTSYANHMSQNSAASITDGDDEIVQTKLYGNTDKILYAAGAANEDDYEDDDDDEEEEEEEEEEEDSGYYYKISEICVARESCASFTLNGHFYLLGGISEDDEPVNSGEYYDANTDSWETVDDMWPFDDKDPPSVGVVNNKLYALKPNTTEIIHYDGLTNSWSKFANLPKVGREINEYLLLAVGDELWVFVTDVDFRRTSVFSCRPQLGESTVSWKRSFTDLPSGLHILDFVAIEIYNTLESRK